MKSVFNLISVLILLAGGFSCQTSPTKIVNQDQVQTEAGQDSFQGFLKLNPVILDARSPLDFSVSHSPGAVSVQWQDLNKVQPGYRGILQDDEMSLARRFSLWGINPETPVLVVGSGLQGQGEEGRIAWVLKYLGVKDVQFAAWTVIRSTIPRTEKSPENKPIWKPSAQAHYLAQPEELKKANKDAIILDVRDLTNSESGTEKFRLPVKKISWKKFITSKGLPESKVLLDLQKENISKNKLIYVISENGLSSSTVTFLLREWGYQAKNFSGGYEYLRRAP